MSRLFGIAGVQMHAVAFNAQATVDKMAEIATTYQIIPMGAADHVP